MTEQAKEGERLIELFYDSARQYNFSESHGWELDAKETRKNAKACAVILCKEISFVLGDLTLDDGIFDEAIERREHWSGVLEYLNNHL